MRDVIVQSHDILLTWAWTVGISVSLTIVSTASVVVRLRSCQSPLSDHLISADNIDVNKFLEDGKPIRNSRFGNFNFRLGFNIL